MSKVTIQGNASGTGTFTIAAPNSNTDRTFNLPDSSGTVATTADIPSVDGISGSYTSGTALDVDSSGRVTTSSQPSFWAYCTADTNVNVSSGTPVEFNAERFDVGSNFDTSTYQFTAPVTGKYFFSAGCRIDLVDTASSYIRLRLITSNQELSTILDLNFSADLNYQTHQLASMFDMDAGDTAVVNVLQSGGHTSTHINNSSVYTWFIGYLLG